MTIPLIVFCFAIVMIVIEKLSPGRNWPHVSGWWWRVTLLNVLQVGSIWIAGLFLKRWMMTHRAWATEEFGRIGAALFGYFILTFVYYWWHRWRHEIPFLWRWCHQLHHSPQRIEVITSFYKHPFELIANSVISSLVLYAIGLDPASATLTAIMSGIAELFYHWNVKTPYWLGFLVQRPESHCVHHQEGLHHYNFSDLPLWDMLFGTFHNPRRWNKRCGFGVAEYRLLAMLRGKEVGA
jgi:sterol desaturase/sphingolipid hydroxylase (fatty acid hydroxylase superfamily)